ncbi:hypothetical protein ACMV8I_02595 [Ewingella sp. S1.OA.A_B6]
MSGNQLPLGLSELINQLEVENSATKRFLIGLVRTLTPEQRLTLTDTIFELNQLAESTIPQNNDLLLARGRAISEKTIALLGSAKEG